MKSLLTVSGVVFAHICVFLLLVNGCRGPVSEKESSWTGDTSAYSGGARSASARPAQAVPASAKPAEAVPATPAQGVPASAEPASAKPVPAAAKPATATPANDASAEPDKEKLYRVQKGDMLSTLAVRFGVTAKEIAAANGIGLNDPIYEGKTLKIPAQKPKSAEEKAKAEGEIYVVAKGDVLGTIARKHKVSVAQLKAANNLKSDKIRVGQKLVIPSKSAPAEKTEPAAATPAETSAQAVPAKSVPEEQKPAATPATAKEKSDNGALAVPELSMLEESDEAASAPAEPVPAPATAVPATSVPAE